MTDQQLIDAMLERHITEFHMTPFEICQDSVCKAARWIIESRKCYVSGDIGMANSAETRGE